MNPWEKDWSKSTAPAASLNPWEKDWSSSNEDEPAPYRPAQDSQAASVDYAAKKKADSLSSIAKQLSVPEDVVTSAIDKANAETAVWAQKNPTTASKSNDLFQQKLGQYLDEGATRHRLNTSGVVDTLSGMSLKDIPAMLGSGSASLASGAGELFGSDFLKDAGKSARDYYEPMYSDAIKNELSPTAGVLKSVGESLPGTVAGLAAGAGIGGLVGRAAAPLLGTATSAATAVPTTIGGLSKVIALNAAPSVVGGALGEASVSALSGAEQAANEFDAAIKQNKAAVLASPRGSELLAQSGGNEAAALESLRNEAINKGARNQGIATAVGGLLVPGLDSKVIGKALGSAERVTAKGISDKALNVGRETMQEFLQGYGEQVGGNLAAQSTFDPKRDTTDGALLNASMSGIAGTVMAGAPEIATGAYEASAKGLAAARSISFANPEGPASQAGITPVTIPVAPNVSTPSVSAGVSTGAADGGSNLSVPSVGDTGLAPTVGRGLGSPAGGDVAAITESGAVSQQSAQPTTSVNPIPRTSDSDLLSRLPQEAEAATQPATIWTGRSGAGYETIEAANQALETRNRKDPEMSWKVEQRPDGKYHLAGYATGEANVPAPSMARQPAIDSNGAELRTETGLGPQGDPANVQGRENLGDAQATADLSSRIGRTLSIVTPETMRGLPANSPRARAYRVFNRFAGIANTAFGYKPVAITGLQQYGVQYDGRAYVDIDEMSDGRGEGLAGMALLVMGHEVGHAMQKSADAADRAAYQGLRSVVVKYAKDGVIDRRQRFEDSGAIADGGKAQGRDYAIDEVVNDVNGAMWRDDKFWGMLYDLDSGSTMRKIAYKFMQAATKVIGAAKKNGFNDIETLVGDNIEVVREAAAKAWADRAMRKGKDFKARPALKAELFDADPSMKRKGVVGEVAPFPAEKVDSAIDQMSEPQLAQNIERKITEDEWNDQDDGEKVMATRDVYRKQVDRVMGDMGLRGWAVEFSSGTFEGKENPNFIITAPDSATSEQITELANAIGYVLDQKAMITFDENNTADGYQASFLKVVLPFGMDAAKVKQLRQWIAEKAPSAGGDTLRDGALVYGNFNDGVSDADFKQAIDAAVDEFAKSADITIDVSDVLKWQSGYIEPASREDYLEGTRYGGNTTGEVATRGDSVRSATGDRRAWIEGVGRDAIARRKDWIDNSTSGRARAKVQGRALAEATQSSAEAERDYGVAREGSVAKVGVHFSQQRRTFLSSQFHGSGLKGAERDRAQSSNYIKDRLFFYVDSGTGVTPEAGVGGVKHIVKLNNLYDVSKDPKGFGRMSTGATEQERQTKFENLVKNAGFDGYFMDKGANQDFAVLIGKHSIEMPAYKRKSVEDYNDIGNINELGNFNLDADYANSTKDDFSFPDLSAADAKLDAANSTEAEMAQRLRDEQEDAKKFKMLLARELEESGFSVVGTPKVASTKERNFAEVKPADLKQAGLMAEEAYPDLEYSKDPSDPMVDRAYFVVDGKRYRATISSSSPKIDQGAFEANAKKDAKGFMSGYELGGLSEQAKKDWNKRFAASADLIRRNFDIFTSVPAKARDNVLATWKAISQNPAAFEFGKADEAKGKNAKEVAQDIADKMMAGGRYKVKIGSPDYHRGDSDFSIMITDTKTGAEGSADVEFWMREKEVTMHTHELDKGSGMGKPVYQIGQAFADKFKARINADGILLGVNNYRRTEQMFSGMLRSGNYDTMQPGVGQRIYGWNERAKTQEQQDRNMVRTALAMARNVQEFVPDIQKFGFDLATNRFYFKDKPDTTESRLMAGVEIKRILSNSDVRVASISRSTLARAAITFEAMGGKEIDASKVAEPVLYKRKQRRLDERTDVQPMLDDLGRSLKSQTPASIDKVMSRIADWRKSLDSVNEASFQDELIDVGSRAIDVALAAGVKESDSRSSPVPIGATPHVLRMLGFDMSPLRVDSRVVGKILNGKHSADFVGVTAKEFVNAIYNPVLVTRLQAKDEVEIVTSLTSPEDGLPVVFMVKRGAVFQGQRGENGAPMKPLVTHALMSAYSKPSFWTVHLRSAIKSGSLLYANVGELQSLESKNPALGGVLSSVGALRYPDTLKAKPVSADTASLPPSSDGESLRSERANVSIGSAQSGLVAPSASRLTKDIAKSVMAGNVKGYGDLVNFVSQNYNGDGDQMPTFKRKEPVSDSKLERWAEGVFSRGAKPGDGVVISSTLPHEAMTMSPGTEAFGRNQPVVIEGHALGHAAKHLKDGITAKMIGMLPDALKSPRMISFQAPGQMMVMLPIRAEDGSPVVVILKKETMVQGYGRLKVARFSTTYPLSNSAAFLVSEIKKGNRVWLPLEEVSRLQDLLSGANFPSDSKSPRHTQGPSISGGSTPSREAFNVLSDDALVKKQAGNKDWAKATEQIIIKDDAEKQLRGVAFKRKQVVQRAPGLPGESRFMAVRRKLQDQYIQIRELQDMLTARGGVVGEAQDVYRAEERMHGRAQELLTDFSRSQIEPFVAKAAKMGVSLDEVALYAYAKHAEERNAYIKSINPKIGDAGSGMSDAHAQNIIQMVKLAGDDQKFDELHQDLMGITATTRRVLLDEGLITQEEYDGWEGLYENYVPLRGFEDVNHETATPLRGTGRGFSMTGKESVKALGRTSKAGDILENILRDYERAVIRSEKNAVAKTFLDLATSNPDPDLWEVQPVKTNRSFNKASGMVLMTNTPDTGDETIAIKVAGQQVRVKINDPLILRAMKQASKDETSQLERLLASTLGVYTNLMRNTLTRYNPIFGAINAVRDAQMGAVSAYDELGAEGAKLYAKYLPVALAASWRQERNKANPNGAMDKWIQEMRFAGGTTGGYHMRDTSEITDAMRTLMLQAGATPNTVGEKVRASLAYQKAAAAMKWLEIVGSTSEDAARVAAYRAAREMGKTPAQAASIAKNLTTNFNRKGEWGTTLNSLYLFFNAGVQGTTRVLEALGNRRVQYLMAGATAAAMTLALINAGQGDDDDGQNYWDKIPDFEKERNLIFMLPPGVEMDGASKVGTRGRYIKVPLPYGINVFPVLGNQIADLARYAKDPSQGVKPAKAAINLVSAVFGSINPFGGSMDPTDFSQLAMAVSPTASDLGLQLGLGINAFGRPVGPEKSPFDEKPDSENFSARQAGTASQQVARWINSVTGGNEGRSGKIDVMPGTIDNLVRNTTGGLGVFLADTFVNLPTKIASPVETTNRDIPLLRNFYGQIDEVTDVGLFYDRRATMTKEMKAAQAEMKLGVDVDYTPESVTMQTLGKAAEGYTKWMSALRKEEIAIAADDTLTKGDKMLKRRELEKQRGELAKSFNTMYNEEMKALK